MKYKNEVDILLTFNFWTRIKILFGVPITIRHNFNGAENGEIKMENGEINIYCKKS